MPDSSLIVISDKDDQDMENVSENSKYYQLQHNDFPWCSTLLYITFWDFQNGWEIEHAICDTNESISIATITN